MIYLVSVGLCLIMRIAFLYKLPFIAPVDVLLRGLQMLPSNSELTNNNDNLYCEFILLQTLCCIFDIITLISDLRR
jgi:hypothetical protein